MNRRRRFFVNLILKPTVIWKMSVYQEYRELSVPANRIRHQIWILQVKIQYLVLKETHLILDIFKLFFVTAIADVRSELSRLGTLNFSG